MILIVGKLANSSARSKLIKTTSVAVALSWIFRVMAFNWISIFISDTLYKASKRTLDVPVTALIYSRPESKKLLTYLIFREIALAVSKGLTALAAFVVIYLTGQILLTFVMAAIFTLFYFYWTDQIIKEKVKK